MRIFLITASSLLTIGAMLPYLMGVAHGKDKPRIVSWFIWSLLAGIGGAVALASHQLPSAAYLFATCIASAAVVVLGFKNGIKKVEKLDIFCLIGAVIGLSTWIFFHSPTATVIIVIFIDFVGAIPTIKHGWLYPHEETWLTFALFVVAEIITLSISDYHVFNGYAITLFYLLEDGTLTLCILLSPHRDHIQKTEKTSSLPLGENTNKKLFVSNTKDGTQNVLGLSETPPVTSKILKSPTNLVIPRPAYYAKLSWNAVFGAANYQIYRDDIHIASSSVPAFVDTSIVNGTYRYYVTANNSNVESQRSNTAYAIINQFPTITTNAGDQKPNNTRY